MLQPNKKHMLCDVDPDTGELYGVFCEEVSVLQKEENIFTGLITLVMVLWLNGVKKKFRMERELLNGQRCMREFFGQGLSFIETPENVEAIMDYVLESDKQAPTVYVHDKLGFYTIDNHLVFLGNTMIGHPTKQSSYRSPELSSPTNASQPEKTAPQGTLDAWLTIVNYRVLGNIHLQLALAIGLSAPVAHLLRAAKVIAEVPFWSLIGESSTGKTTALRLMASCWGSPEESDGLISDFHTTETAFFAMLEGFGIPHLIDEATREMNRDFAPIIYSLSKGADKWRCDTKGIVKARKKFSGVVVISGENSLFEQSTPNLGTYARMVELNLTWTNDADHARRLSAELRRNYGTAAEPFVKLLLQIQEETPQLLEQLFDTELTKLKTEIGNVSGPEERLLNMYATVL